MISLDGVYTFALKDSCFLVKTRDKILEMRNTVRWFKAVTQRWTFWANLFLVTKAKSKQKMANFAQRANHW